MRNAIKIAEVELCEPIPSFTGLEDYRSVQVLVRLCGTPIGTIARPLVGGRCAAPQLVSAILEEHGSRIMRELLYAALAQPVPPAGLEVDTLFQPPAPEPAVPAPLLSIAVCTRDRTADLAICLEAINRLDYRPLDVLVIDNAPSTDATSALVARRFPHVRYVREPRPGLDWARNRAILESRGEILAFTDDDVVVDRGWAGAIARAFHHDRDVMALTGLVLPYELETEAQRLFERYGGFGRGFDRRWFRVAGGRHAARRHAGTGTLGTGANMAFRRSLFDRIGGFDPALDVGTVTNGGGDLEMFFRVLKAGETLAYDPRALVWHRHRRQYRELVTQIANNGLGFYSYLVRSALHFPDERQGFIRFGAWWLWFWNVRRLLQSLTRRPALPRELLLAELAGSFRGLRRYRRAAREAERIARHSALPALPRSSLGPIPPAPRTVPEAGVAVREIDVAEPLCPIEGLEARAGLRLIVRCGPRFLGSLDIECPGPSLSVERLRQEIVEACGIKLMNTGAASGTHLAWAELLTGMKHRYRAASNAGPEPAPGNDLALSVVVATRDRPEDLRRCLRALVSQRSREPVEVVVVDNHPGSGLTAPVVSEFPGVVLIDEPRPGLSYARNAGIAASRGQIIACTDDDVIAPPDWIAKLTAPFGRPDVMAVTGNVLPLELETRAQRVFESYGGLGRGFTPFTVDHDWFHRWRRSVPTWELGSTANAAFRASIFADPAIGLLDEALGAGTPTGCSEDTYLFYKVLKTGYTIAYEPDACVWHRHRRDNGALKRQIYAYSKGHVAYQLTTWMRDGDWRALVRLGYELPRTYWRRGWARLRDGSEYPLSLLALEVAGNLAGPWALWRSRRHVRHEGRSEPYRPPAMRVPSLTRAPDPTSTPERLTA